MASLGSDKPIGRIERQSFIIFRDQMERIPSSLKQEDFNLTLPELANKYGHRIEAIVASRRVVADEQDEGDLSDDDREQGMRPQADASIGKALRIIKAMFSLAFADGAIPVNPCQKITSD